MRKVSVVAVAILLLTQAGCSVSDSVSASSKSVSSPFKWSSKSSPDSDGKSEAYVDDVRDYTVAYVETGAELSAFASGIGRVAERHGISNWQADRASYVGIGRGLRKAGVQAGELEAYKAAIAGDDQGRAADIQSGWDDGGQVSG